MNRVLDESVKRALSAQMLTRHVLGELNEITRIGDAYSMARALAASGASDWATARFEKEFHDKIVAERRVAPRLFNSFFAPGGLQRDLSTSATGLVDQAAPLTAAVTNAANDFLPLCTVIPSGQGSGVQQVGRFDTLPAATVLANQTSSIGETSPTTSRTLMDASNAGVYIEESRAFALQSERGARAVVRLLTNALRNHVQVQIIEGSGSSGQVLGLANDSAVDTASGGTLTYATVCDAIAVVEDAAGDGPLAWVLTSAAAKIMRQRPVVGTDGAAILSDGKIGGYPAVVIGGTTSATAVFGRWQDLIVYEWLPIEIAVNPLANFKSAIIGVRGWVSFNAAPLVNGSFSTLTSLS